MTEIGIAPCQLSLWQAAIISYSSLVSEQQLESVALLNLLPQKMSAGSNYQNEMDLH